MDRDILGLQSLSELQTALGDKTRAELQTIYNKLPNAKPLKRLRNKPVALNAIWAALHPEDSPKPARKRAEKPKAKPRKAPAQKQADGPREGSKQAKLISLMRRKSGVTVAEVMDKLGWQAHTCRGLISTLRSKGVVEVETSKNKAGATVYKSA